MSVPKCKECDHYKTESLRDYSNDKERWCHFTYHKISEDGISYSEKIGNWTLGKYITGNEARTSPKWCPKRG